MKNEFYLHFDEGMPKGTAQEKGEKIMYKIQNGRRVPYIHHYRKNEVEITRRVIGLKMARFRPEKPSYKPIKLEVFLYFDVKERKKWGSYKDTKPDCDNYVKEIKDIMTALGFWGDDAQVVDLRVVKRYAEKATICIRWEELEDGPT